MTQALSISLIIPVFNESKTIPDLIATIKKQSYQPAEIIFVDGGSADNTVSLIKELTVNDTAFQVIEAGRAMPGKGRNIGAENARNEWLAFTDAGITLEVNWLKNMVLAAALNPDASIIYGNFSPYISSLFEKCATIAYVPASQANSIRTKSIASSLFKKEVWKKAGGFPDWRAAEDLVFMENAEQLNYKIAYATDAMMYWQLQPDLKKTYRKFELYSKYNVWAGRQASWHYGIAKQYAVLFIVVLLSIFHSAYWLLLIPAWLVARVSKRILSHKFEFGLKPLFNPGVFFLVMMITLNIDAATFSGWLKALITKKPES
jgi:glycosyltransferase involved in cell wall biosynthesis